jgi:hypothetical protein
MCVSPSGSAGTALSRARARPSGTRATLYIRCLSDNITLAEGSLSVKYATKHAPQEMGEVQLPTAFMPFSF